MEEYSGWAFKLGEKGFVKNLTWKKRWCELKGPRLRYYKEKGAPQFQGFVDLTTATGLVKDSSKKSPGNFSFEVHIPQPSLLQAKKEFFFLTSSVTRFL
jgi:hypothetical protein